MAAGRSPKLKLALGRPYANCHYVDVFEPGYYEATFPDGHISLMKIDQPRDDRDCIEVGANVPYRISGADIDHLMVTKLNS